MASVGPRPIKRHEPTVMALAGSKSSQAPWIVVILSNEYIFQELSTVRRRGNSSSGPGWGLETRRAEKEGRELSRKGKSLASHEVDRNEIEGRAEEGTDGERKEEKSRARNAKTGGRRRTEGATDNGGRSVTKGAEEGGGAERMGIEEDDRGAEREGKSGGSQTGTAQRPASASAVVRRRRIRLARVAWVELGTEAPSSFVAVPSLTAPLRQRGACSNTPRWCSSPLPVPTTIPIATDRDRGYAERGKEEGRRRKGKELERREKGIDERQRSEDGGGRAWKGDGEEQRQLNGERWWRTGIEGRMQTDAEA
ncbi:hypothetical protein B0H17DRAFT_1142766 [Mycena rosella]|uniref:Uncharacterized protein n=1 Tax=Mycena rosella TaxID=1033263 RepID=A0AAD7CWN6_MYCRO|nr:hypothetical protein B0H17DRAFT_1142766 [Mycena rosella]